MSHVVLVLVPESKAIVNGVQNETYTSHGPRVLHEIYSDVNKANEKSQFIV